MPVAGRAILIYVAIILALVAAGFLHQTVGISGVAALAVVFIAGVAIDLRRPRAPS
jgi:hypothetical protein